VTSLSRTCPTAGTTTRFPRPRETLTATYHSQEAILKLTRFSRHFLLGQRDRSVVLALELLG
jgi:hypothetical protein